MGGGEQRMRSNHLHSSFNLHAVDAVHPKALLYSIYTYSVSGSRGGGGRGGAAKSVGDSAAQPENKDAETHF